MGVDTQVDLVLEDFPWSGGHAGGVPALIHATECVVVTTVAGYFVNGRCIFVVLFRFSRSSSSQPSLHTHMTKVCKVTWRILEF